MVVSASDMIPLQNKILGVCSQQMRWYNSPFPIVGCSVSETRSETSEVIFAEHHTLAHLSSYSEKPFKNKDMLYSNGISGNEIQNFWHWAVLFGSRLLPNFLASHKKGQLWVKLDGSHLSYFSLSADLLMVNIIKRFST